MTIDDLRELARLADGVEGHSPDRVAEVHRRIDRTQWRRAASVAAAAVVLSVAVVACSVALGNLAGYVSGISVVDGPPRRTWPGCW